MAKTQTLAMAIDIGNGRPGVVRLRGKEALWCGAGRIVSRRVAKHSGQPKPVSSLLDFLVCRSRGSRWLHMARLTGPSSGERYLKPKRSDSGTSVR